MQDLWTTSAFYRIVMVVGGGQRSIHTPFLWGSEFHKNNEMNMGPSFKILIGHVADIILKVHGPEQA